MNRRRNNQALARKIGPEAAPGNLQCRLIDLPSPDFHGKHGFELYNRKAGDQRPRAPLFENTVHIIGAGLLVVQFRQCAGVEKIVWHSAFLPESDDGLGKRTGNCGECASHFIERHIIVSSFGPFFGREVSGNVLAGGRGVRDGHGDLLPFFKGQGLQRLEHAVLVYGLKRLLHTVSV